MKDKRYSEEDIKDWEQFPMISSVLTSSHFGAWLYYRDKRRDKRIESELLDKVAEKLKTDIEKYWYRSELDMSADNVNCLIDEDIEEMKAEVDK